MSVMRKKNNAEWSVVGKDRLGRPVYSKRSRACVESQGLLFPPRDFQAMKVMDVPHLEEELCAVADDPEMRWSSGGQEKFLDAIDWMQDLHSDQWRKNRADHPVTPYAEHPMRCALRLHRMGIRDGDLITAAILHDTIEDCADKMVDDPSSDPVALEAQARGVVASRMNERVAEHVWNVSNHPMPPVRSREEKYERYSDKLTALIQSDPTSFIVKISDLHDNASGLKYMMSEGNEKRIRNQCGKYLNAVQNLQQHVHHLDDVECAEEVKKMLETIKGNLIALDADLTSRGA